MNEKETIDGLKQLLGMTVTPEELKTNTYNQWLDRFRSVPTARLLSATDWLQENLPIEAYAAAARWVEIIGNPHRIDKLLQSKLDKDEEEDLMNLAIGDDQEAFYVALVKKTARELNESATSQEVARLSMNLKIFQSELAAIRSKKAKKGSLIEKIMSASAMPLQAPQSAKKAPKKAKKKSTTKPKAKKTKSTTKEVKNARNNNHNTRRPATPASSGGTSSAGTKDAGLGNSGDSQHHQPVPEQTPAKNTGPDGGSNKEMAGK